MVLNGVSEAKGNFPEANTNMAGDKQEELLGSTQQGLLELCRRVLQCLSTRQSHCREMG